MTRKPIPLSQAHILKKLFDQYTRYTRLEFAKCTVEEQYELAFSRLTKPNIAYELNIPGADEGQLDDPSLAPFMLGNDQRDLFLPRLFEHLPQTQAQELTKIFDLGCGDGQTSQYVLERIAGNIDLRVLDNNPKYIQLYTERVNRLDRKINISAQCGDIDSALTDLGIFGKIGDCDLIFAVHMAYFTENIDAFMNFFIDRLKTNGRMFLVFADEMLGYTGRAYRRFLEVRSAHSSDPYWQNILRLHDLFGFADNNVSRLTSQLALSRGLGRDDFSAIEVIRQPSRIYGNDPGDIIAAAFVTNLLYASDASIGRKIEFVSEFVASSPVDVDLAFETKGCRKGMLSVSQPQFLVVIEKK